MVKIMWATQSDLADPQVQWDIKFLTSGGQVRRGWGDFTGFPAPANLEM